MYPVILRVPGSEVFILKMKTLDKDLILTGVNGTAQIMWTNSVAPGMRWIPALPITSHKES
jgi:hypothetical protein